MEEINEIIGWYRSLHPGYCEVNELMYKRSILATFLFTYTSYLGELRREWNVAQATRENNKNKLHHKFILDKKPSNQAELLAKLNTSEELMIEKQAEGMYYEHRENIESVKEVLNAMNQHIAISRDELARRNAANLS